MKKKALLTGTTGFIGRNISPLLAKEYDLVTPDRSVLDLKDQNSVRDYLASQKFDVIFHCANPNPFKNSLDSYDSMSTDSLRIFLNLQNCSNLYGKMVYTGSGAEYDKTKDIINVKEYECFRSIPKDDYGFAKYVMNKIANESDNIINVCIFGCFGPTDHSSKFITHCIHCCMDNNPITIKQDCRFDYIHVIDLARIMSWLGNNNPKYHMYNASGCCHLLLSEIAKEVRNQMSSNCEIIVLSDGLNNEYTADGQRFFNESKIQLPMNISEGISLQIKAEKGKLL